MSLDAILEQRMRAHLARMKLAADQAHNRLEQGRLLRAYSERLYATAQANKTPKTAR